MGEGSTEEVTQSLEGQSGVFSLTAGTGGAPSRRGSLDMDFRLAEVLEEDVGDAQERRAHPHTPWWARSWAFADW